MVTKIILANDTEINYAKQNGLSDSLNLSLIPMIKRITSKTRINLKNNSKKLTNEINGFIDKHSDSKIIFFSQFNKGDIRAKEELKIIGEIQQKSNLDTFVFQELDERNTLEDFKKDFESSKKFSKEKEIFAVVDIKSKFIQDKVDFLLVNGIKNFIFRGGEYDNVRKWIEIRESIRKLKGNFIISVYGRWDRDKVSYFKYALEFDCDYTFHEKPAPYPVKIQEILNLNDNFVYELISVNGDYGINITDENNYSFSRVRTLLKAQELSRSVQLIQIS
ncbi:MAG: hypothetical protein ABIH79_02095 [archaeon]